MADVSNMEWQVNRPLSELRSVGGWVEGIRPVQASVCSDGSSNSCVGAFVLRSCQNCDVPGVVPVSPCCAERYRQPTPHSVTECQGQSWTPCSSWYTEKRVRPCSAAASGLKPLTSISYRQTSVISRGIRGR